MARSVRSLRPRTCLLALAVVAALVALAGPLRATEHEATVFGTVTDAETGDPIEGASVVVGEFDQIFPTTTDSDGNYQVDGIEPGVYNVVANARRYALSTERVELADAETREVDFALEPREPAAHGIGYFEGNDEDMTEEFVGAACFEATHSVYGLRGEGTYHGLDDTGAEVVFDVEVAEGEEIYDAGPLELEIEATETYYHGPEGTHGTDALDACTVEAGAPIPAEFRLFAEGHVDDGAGGPCVGEGEFWRDGDPMEASWTLTSDCTVESDDGDVGQAPAGTEQILQGVHEPCFDPGAEYCPDNIRGDFGQNMPDFQAPPGAIAGTVVDADSDEPVDGATVSAGDHEAATDTDGTYRFDGLDPGDYTVSAEADGYASATQQATVDAEETTTVDFALDPLAPLPFDVGLLNDINPDGASQPEQFTPLGDEVLFAADDGVHGSELWITDGTEDGTRMVTEINPGSATSWALFDGGAVLDDTAYFFADGGVHGFELWASDGTEDGTRMVADINPDGAGYPEQLTTAGDQVFFTADDGEHGVELWASDGTEEGTRLVRDINPGGAGAFIAELTAAGDTLFFRAHDGTSPTEELWKSDGTEDGTQKVKDIDPGGVNPHPQNLTAVGDRLYFAARHSVYERELWTSDGTEDGTRLVKDINPGGQSNPRALTEFGDTVLFSADDGVHEDELWATDGTEEGTRLVKDINPDEASGPWHLVAAGDTLFFSADDGVHGEELWASDGTTEGTRLVRDIDPDGESEPQNLTAIGDRVFFTADDGVHGRELWTSDGTSDGTRLVGDINPGGAGSNLDWLTAVDDTLYFAADDGVHGFEPWILTVQPGAVAGQVTDADTGEAIEGAEVSATGTGGEAVSTTTGADGGYELADLEPGDYTVTADADGFHAAAMDVTVEAGETTSVDIALDAETGAVAGVVTDALTGDPVEGASVTIDGAETTTGADGSYEVEELRVGSYTVTVDAEFHDAVTEDGVTVASDETTVVDVVLEPSDPASMDECMDGGWDDYQFRNQGRCMRLVQTGHDSR